jgi:hypothetical protein
MCTLSGLQRYGQDRTQARDELALPHQRLASWHAGGCSTFCLRFLDLNDGLALIGTAIQTRVMR